LYYLVESPLYCSGKISDMETADAAFELACAHYREVKLFEIDPNDKDNFTLLRYNINN